MSLIATNPFDLEAAILVEAAVMSSILSYAQRSSGSTEAGGILLGHRRGKHLHVVRATEPSRADRRTRYQFQREIEPHQTIATRAWQESNQTIDYLGEWHSHPESNPRPSGTDLSEWKKILNRTGDRIVFLIIGNSSAHWLGVGHGRAVMQAKAVESW
jgi:integrative and conjugative element protein (TIGR02256 family)